MTYCKSIFEYKFMCAIHDGYTRGSNFYVSRHIRTFKKEDKMCIIMRMKVYSLFYSAKWTEYVESRF